MAMGPGTFRSPGKPFRSLSLAERASESGFIEEDAVLTPRKDHFEHAPSREGGAPIKAWQCQLVVALTQAAFVVGSVYLKSSLQYVDEEAGETFHPIVYALIRESVAGPILYLLALHRVGSIWPAWHDVARVAGLGVCMFTSQLFYIVGIELSGVTVATCIQPAIPVFTAMLGVALKMESGHPQKLAGIALAVAGSITMVSGGAGGHVAHPTPSQAKAAASMLAGNLCLLVNTFAMACYYILAKQVVARYPAIAVSAWAYIVAATCMASTAVVFTVPADWHFPRALVLPLVYWILVCSVLGYLTITWAMRHLPASQVASFQCLQPFMGTALAFLVLGERPTPWALGAVGVLAGLVLVVRDRHDAPSLGAGAAGMVARLVRATSHMGALVSSRSMSYLPGALGSKHFAPDKDDN